MMFTVVLALTAASSAYSPSPIVEAPPVPADLPALLSRLQVALNDKRDAVQDRMTDLRSAARTAATKMYLTLSPHGRHLQSIDTWLSDLTNSLGTALNDPSTTDLADLLQRFQTVTCENNQPKQSVIDGIDAALQTEIDSLLSGVGTLDVAQVVTPILQCACSGEWDLSTTAWSDLWTAIVPLVTGSATDITTYIETLVPKVKAVTPLMFGSAAMCSSACQTAMRSTITHALTLMGGALPASVTLPELATTNYPGSVVGCMCNGIQYAALMDVLFPPTMSIADAVAAIEGIGDPLNDPKLPVVVSMLARTLSFIFSEGFVCSGTCVSAMRDGMTIGMTIGFHLAWPGEVSTYIAAASTNQLPTTAQIVTAVSETTDCWCSLNYSMMVHTVADNFLPPATLPSSLDDVLAVADTVSGALMNGTVGSGGWCASGACPRMMGAMMSLGSKMMVVALENTYDVNTILVSPNVVTSALLDSVFSTAPNCMCSYWAPDHTGDIFPLIKSKIPVLEACFSDESACDVRTMVFETALQTVRATKACVSGQCRDLFNTVFSIIDNMAANPKTGTPLASVCTAAEAKQCASAACSGIGACTACEGPSATTVIPFSELPGGYARDIYWLGCSMSTECPPEGVRSFSLDNQFTFSGDVDSFDLPGFKTTYASVLAAPNSTFEGAIVAEDITATKEAGSTIVKASVTIHNQAVLESAQATLTALSTAAATDHFGVTVEGITDAAVSNDAFTPPSPPRAAYPGDTVPGSTQQILGLDLPVFIGIVVAAVVVIVALIVILIVCCCCCCKKSQSHGSMGAGAASVQGKPTFQNNL